MKIIFQTLAGAAILLLTACATNGQPQNTVSNTESPEASATTEQPNHSPNPTEKKFVNAVAAPLNDLNIVKAKIPPILKKAQEGTYSLSAAISCVALSHEIDELDAALGADIDTPSTDKNPSLIERGTEAGGDMAVNAVRRTTEGIIPFRGWIRKLSGAERYARDVSASITAGSLRRSFLKGVRQASGCTTITASSK
jgi:hypothetical protein